MTRYLFMKVSTDKYELPLAVADSAEELARMLGIQRNAIESVISKRAKKSKYIKVELIEDEDE